MKTISKNTKNDISKLSFIERFELKLKANEKKGWKLISKDNAEFKKISEFGDKSIEEELKEDL